MFIVDMPVGSGKSSILYTIARLAHDIFKADSYYITTKKTLQDQLSDDFGDNLPQIKGRANYYCLDNPNVNCDKGRCLFNGKKSRHESAEQIEIRLDSGEFTGSEIQCRYYETRECKYLAARDKAMNASVCGTNFDYFYIAKTIMRHRSLLIIDEAHSMPEMMIDKIKLSMSDVHDRARSTRFVEIPRFDLVIPVLDSVAKYVEWFENEALPSITERISVLEAVKAPIEQYLIHNVDPDIIRDSDYIIEKIARLREISEKIGIIFDDQKQENCEWVFEKSDHELTLTPLTSARFLKEMLYSRADKVIVASGTIIPPYFIREAGLKHLAFNSKTCVFSAPSLFPSENSPVYYITDPALTMTKDKKESSWPRMMQEIEAIIENRQDRRGIIHSHSYEFANYIVNNIRADLRYLLFTHDSSNRNERLDQWLHDTRQASVFVSVNFGEGLDLKGDLCHYQIYVKAAYPALGDARANRRWHVDKEWYYYQAVENAEQASGRATRTEDDWSEMFILDYSFCFPLLFKQKKYFKRWFLERLHQIKSAVYILPMPIR